MIYYKNFTAKEFECKCGCGFNILSPKLLDTLTLLRLDFNSPIYITSGCRCEKHNSNIGGAKKSKHLQGIACDLKMKNISPQKIYEYLDEKYSDTFGIGKYSSWVHLDVREERARW